MLGINLRILLIPPLALGLLALSLFDLMSSSWEYIAVLLPSAAAFWGAYALMEKYLETMSQKVEMIKDVQRRLSMLNATKTDT